MNLCVRNKTKIIGISDFLFAAGVTIVDLVYPARAARTKRFPFTQLQNHWGLFPSCPSSSPPPPPHFCVSATAANLKSISQFIFHLDLVPQPHSFMEEFRKRKVNYPLPMVENRLWNLLIKFSIFAINQIFQKICENP